MIPNVDYIPADLSETHHRLEEWARWLRPPGGPHGSCYSIEGRYEPPRLDENGIVICDECGHVTRVAMEIECPSCKCPFPPFAKPAESVPKVNLILAMAVECAVRHLDNKSRLHLRCWYVFRLSPNTVRKRIALPEAELGWHLNRARMMVRNRLARSEMPDYTAGSRVNPDLPSDHAEGRVLT